MLNEEQILKMSQSVTVGSSTDEEAANKLAEVLNAIYVDILAEVESMIEFKLSGLSEETKVIVPESQQLIGRMPWYIRKKRMEEKFKKLSEPTEKIEESA